ncbi:MAG: hypothetical protein V1756_01035 [Patescibacteria group bacterium]
MILTAHLLAGAAVATVIKNPFLGLSLAFLSHYLLDTIFHREYNIENILEKRWEKSRTEFLSIFLDFFTGISLVLLLSKNLSLALPGAFMASLPDGFALLYFLLFPNISFIKIHNKLHQKIHFLKNKKIRLFWRISSQILVISFSIYLL